MQSKRAWCLRSTLTNSLFELRPNSLLGVSSEESNDSNGEGERRPPGGLVKLNR